MAINCKAGSTSRTRRISAQIFDLKGSFGTSLEYKRSYATTAESNTQIECLQAMNLLTNTPESRFVRKSRAILSNGCLFTWSVEFLVGFV
jgi:hypothetical protein